MDSLEKFGKDSCYMALRIFEKTNSHQLVSEAMNVSFNIACQMVLAALRHKKSQIQRV